MARLGMDFEIHFGDGRLNAVDLATEALVEDIPRPGPIDGEGKDPARSTNRPPIRGHPANGTIIHAYDRV